MKSNKPILSIAFVICIVGSVSATYFYMDDVKNSEINSLTKDYEDKIDKYIDISIDFQNQIFSLTDQVYNLSSTLNNTNNEIIILKEKWAETNNTLDEKDVEIENLRTGNKYELHDPTYNEVASFIASDTTDEIPFDFDTFDCENYVLEINNNAEDQGIRCSMVVMYFDGSDTGHAIVGFNTVDRGMVYVEPQTDDWVENLEIGNDYWTECVVPKPGYVYNEEPYDTINEILIYW